MKSPIQEANWISRFQSIKNPFEDLGCSLTLKVNRRCKRYRMVMTSPTTVELQSPPFQNIDQIEAFIIEQKPWVAKMRTKIKSKDIPKSLTITSETGYRTDLFEIQFIGTETDKFSWRQTTSKPIAVVEFNYPKDIDQRGEEFQSTIQALVKSCLKFFTKTILKKRTIEFALKHNLLYNKVSVRDTKRQWGSCSGTDNISLSIYLAKLPVHLSDYIILHELAHIKHKNHGPDFKKLLDSMTSGKEEELRLELKQYSTTIFLNPIK